MRNLVWLVAFTVVGVGCGVDDSKTVLAPDGSDRLASGRDAPGKWSPFRKIIELPDGFRPEGIAIGIYLDFYVGSLADGAIYRGDLRTGEGDIFVPGTGGVAAGLEFDRRSGRLLVAGGPTGLGSIYDAETGERIAAYELAEANAGFINDVVATDGGAYFTNSFAPVLYRIPLGHATGVHEYAVEEVPLGDGFAFVPGEFNANGIEATPGGSWLIVVNSFRGELYRVDPESGEAQLIDLGGENVMNGDGLLLEGRTLYVVQNFLNQIAVVRLDREWGSGEVVRLIKDPAFDIPTTVGSFGPALYAVNSHFDEPPTPETEYEIVRVEKRSRYMP